MKSAPIPPLEQVEAKGDTVLKFREIEGPNGTSPRMFVALDFEITPLGFQELITTELHKPISVRLNVKKARLIDTDIHGLAREARLSFDTTVETPFLSQAIGLVKGGWLPSPLAATNANHIVLLDRNAISKIANLFDHGARKSGAADFLDLYRDREVRLSPMLFALEGNVGAIPGPDIVRAQLTEAAERLRIALPKADVISGEKVEQGVLGLIQESRFLLDRQERFLKDLFSWLRSPVARKDVDRRWHETLDAADRCELSRKSLVVFATLSAIAMPGRNLARDIFKFKQEYSSKSIYNALADFRSLELLASYIKHYPQLQVQLCTADFAMAAFWVGIRASGFDRTAMSRFDLDPVSQLMPDEFINRWRRSINA